MAPIATYVFFDLGTTYLRKSCPPKITEIHMIAIKREDLRRYFHEGGEEYFAKRPASQKLHYKRCDDMMWTGVTNRIRDAAEEDTLKEEIVEFLDDLPKPVCLIAHNGYKFDFPLLKSWLDSAEEFSPKDVMCADSMFAFYDILEPNSLKTSSVQRCLGSFPWPDFYEDRKGYRLGDVFKRQFGFYTSLEDAKEGNNAMKEIALDLSFEFMLWIAENKRRLSSF